MEIALGRYTGVAGTAVNAVQRAISLSDLPVPPSGSPLLIRNLLLVSEDVARVLNDGGGAQKSSIGGSKGGLVPECIVEASAADDVTLRYVCTFVPFPGMVAASAALLPDGLVSYLNSRQWQVPVGDRGGITGRGSSTSTTIAFQGSTLSVFSPSATATSARLYAADAPRGIAVVFDLFVPSSVEDAVLHQQMSEGFASGVFSTPGSFIGDSAGSFRSSGRKKLKYHAIKSYLAPTFCDKDRVVAGGDKISTKEGVEVLAVVVDPDAGCVVDDSTKIFVREIVSQSDGLVAGATEASFGSIPRVESVAMGPLHTRSVDVVTPKRDLSALVDRGSDALPIDDIAVGPRSESLPKVEHRGTATVDAPADVSRALATGASPPSSPKGSQTIRRTAAVAGTQTEPPPRSTAPVPAAESLVSATQRADLTPERPRQQDRDVIPLVNAADYRSPVPVNHQSNSTNTMRDLLALWAKEQRHWYAHKRAILGPNIDGEISLGCAIGRVVDQHVPAVERTTADLRDLINDWKCGSMATAKLNLFWDCRAVALTVNNDGTDSSPNGLPTEEQLFAWTRTLGVNPVGVHHARRTAVLYVIYDGALSSSIPEKLTAQFPGGSTGLAVFLERQVQGKLGTVQLGDNAPLSVFAHLLHCRDQRVQVLDAALGALPAEPRQIQALAARLDGLQFFERTLLNEPLSNELPRHRSSSEHPSDDDDGTWVTQELLGRARTRRAIEQVSSCVRVVRGSCDKTPSPTRGPSFSSAGGHRSFHRSPTQSTTADKDSIHQQCAALADALADEVGFSAAVHGDGENAALLPHPKCDLGRMLTYIQDRIAALDGFVIFLSPARGDPYAASRTEELTEWCRLVMQSSRNAVLDPSHLTAEPIARTNQHDAPYALAAAGRSVLCNVARKESTLAAMMRRDRNGSLGDRSTGFGGSIEGNGSLLKQLEVAESECLAGYEALQTQLLSVAEYIDVTFCVGKAGSGY